MNVPAIAIVGLSKEPIEIEQLVDGPVDVILHAAPRGPMGPAGQNGLPGAPGDGATDPGDLTLIFNNHLL